MTKEELQNATDEIRKHLVDSDLDKATARLLEVTKAMNYEAHKEAMIISSNWNELERDIRGSLIREQEEKVQRSQLVAQILDFTRDLEGMRKIPKEIPPLPPEKKSSNKLIYVGVAFAISCVVAFFVINQPKEISKDDALAKTEKLANKGEVSEALTERKTAEPKEKEPKQVPTSKDKEKEPVNYKEQLNMGNQAFKNKNYEKAFFHFKVAAEADNSLEIRGKINEVTEKCYRKYFTQGMDHYNDGDYSEAKKDFEMAQNYKDITQVKAMIKRCGN